MPSRTLVVIPAYNEELNIENAVNDVIANVPEVDYIVINDGSRDNTLEVLKNNRFHYINCICNLGLSGAVQMGFKYAQANDYDIVIQFDGDGQHPAEYITELVKEIENGNDIVIGSRFVTEKKPYTARMIGSRLVSLSIKLITGKTIKDPTSGYRAYNRKCIHDYADNMNNPPEPDTLVYMLKKKRKIKEIQVYMREREFGESYLNITRSMQYMCRMMVSIFLIQPLRKG